MTISIVLADDHPVVRRGMRALLEAEPDISIVAEASDGLEAVRLAERTKPNVLVLDLMMPGLSGLEVLRILRERAPETRVVILSMQSSKAVIAEALNIGATGYVLKGSTENNLIRAVRRGGRETLPQPTNHGECHRHIHRTSESGAVRPARNLDGARARGAPAWQPRGKTGPKSRRSSTSATGRWRTIELISCKSSGCRTRRNWFATPCNAACSHSRIIRRACRGFGRPARVRFGQVALWRASQSLGPPYQTSIIE